MKKDLIELVNNSDAVEGIFIGRNDKGQLVLFSTNPHASYYHHLLNSAVFQLNVIENDRVVEGIEANG